jgi:hypothetical protein
MDKRTFSFLKAVLGTDGATAMRRAVAKDPRLEGYLIPRTFLGWAMSKSQYEGSMPGIDDIYVQFSKSETTGYHGQIGKSNQPVTPFAADNEFHLVAELIQAFGYNLTPFEGSDRSLSTLGKSVDALLKARALTAKLEKNAQGKVDLPGTTHKPTEATGPQEATKPVATQPPLAKPKLPKSPAMLKVAKKDLTKACKTCEGQMFKSERFVGCICWRDLAKHASTTLYSDGAVVEFTKAADRQSVFALCRELSNG